MRSKAELLIDNWLYMAGIVHAYERRLPIQEEAYCDFYLPAGKVYLEYWGLEQEAAYAARQQAKRTIYARYQLQPIELTDAEIRFRPARRASCWACGRMVIVRRGGVERVHDCWLAPSWQSVVANLILMTSFLKRSIAGVQLVLRLPTGHIACCCSQSMVKSRAANPPPSLACQWLSPRVGPIRSIP